MSPRVSKHIKGIIDMNFSIRLKGWGKKTPVIQVNKVKWIDSNPSFFYKIKGFSKWTTITQVVQNKITSLIQTEENCWSLSKIRKKEIDQGDLNKTQVRMPVSQLRPIAELGTEIYDNNAIQVSWYHDQPWRLQLSIERTEHSLNKASIYLYNLHIFYGCKK